MYVFLLGHALAQDLGLAQGHARVQGHAQGHGHAHSHQSSNPIEVLTEAQLRQVFSKLSICFATEVAM